MCEIFGAWAYPKISELESTIKSLQGRLDTSARKVSVAEINAKNLTQERDAAISQLGVAYCTSEELKEENEQLRRENSKLKTEQQLLRDHLQSWNEDREQQNKVWADKEAALREKIERREEAVRQIQDMTREVWQMREASTSKPSKRNDNGGRSLATEVPRQVARKSSERFSDKNTQTRIADQVQNEVKRLKSENQKSSASTSAYGQGKSGSGTVPKSQQITRTRSRSKSRQRSASRGAANEAEAPTEKRVKRVVVEEIEDSDESGGGSVVGPTSRSEVFETDKKGNALDATDKTGDNNYSSFLDVSKMAVECLWAFLTVRR